MPIRKYDSTVARIAGNILSGMTRIDPPDDNRAVKWAVAVARAIVAETIRTEPVAEGDNTPTDQPEDVRATTNVGDAPRLTIRALTSSS